MKENIIIEFFGLPGSGKTTLKNRIIKENKNKNILDFSNHLKSRSFINKNAIKIYLFVRFIFDYIYGLLFIKFSKFTIQQIYFFNLLIHILKKNHKKYDLILIDQGFIQGLSSLFIGLDYKKTYIEKKIMKYIQKMNIMFFNFKIPLTDAMTRVKLRKENIPFFINKINDNTLFSFLEETESKLKKIVSSNLKRISVINIDSRDDIYKNYQIINDLIY